MPGKPFSIFFLAQLTNQGSTGSIGSVVAGLTGAWAVGWANGLQDIARTGDGSLGNPVTATSGVWNLYEYFQSQGGSVSLMKWGSFVGAEAFPYTATASQGLGPAGIRLGSFTSSLGCSLAELAVWSRVLSSDDRQAVEGYFALRYGQTARLPASHPYRTASTTSPLPSLQPLPSLAPPPNGLTGGGPVIYLRVSAHE
jgi:hypothetical protein